MRSKEEILNGEDPTVFLTKCAINFKFFCENCVSEMNGQKIVVADFHLEWFSALQKNKRIAIQAPTGFGKTGILAICYPIWLMMFKRDFKILVVSGTLPQARKIIEEVKHTIEQNELLADLIPSKDIWTKEEINTNTNCKMVCKPYNINIKGYHVDFLLCDEAASFADTRIYYDYVVTRATSRNGTICCISTPESINDLMTQLNNSTEYWSKIYQAEKDGKALWPERFPLEWLMKRKKEMSGEPGAYEREYLCDPSVSSGNNLYPPYIIENTFDYNLKFTRNLEEGTVIGGFDFAIATGPTADFDAYVILERTGSGIFLRYGEFHKGLTIEAKARRIKALREDYKIDKLIIDPNNVGQGVKSDLLKMGITVYEASFQSMARSKMLVNLRRLMGDPKDNIPPQLIIPRSKLDPQTMAFTNRLIDELLGFQAVQTKLGTDTYQSKARHDDTVMALAMACSLISEQRDCLDFVAVG